LDLVALGRGAEGRDGDGTLAVAAIGMSIGGWVREGRVAAGSAMAEDVEVDSSSIEAAVGHVLRIKIYEYR
jgi:hypothetical protein